MGRAAEGEGCTEQEIGGHDGREEREESQYSDMMGFGVCISGRLGTSLCLRLVYILHSGYENNGYFVSRYHIQDLPSFLLIPILCI